MSSASPLHLNKPTPIAVIFPAGQCQNRLWGNRSRAASLFNHLVGAGEERFGNRKADLFRSFDVDDQLELRRLLDRKIGRLCPIYHFDDKRSRTPSQIRNTRSIEISPPSAIDSLDSYIVGSRCIAALSAA
jgi:hypothetical protein